MSRDRAVEADGIGRRGFLKSAGAMAAAVAATKPLFTIAAEAAKGANERPGVGFIGCGGRSGAHMGIVHALQTQGKVEPVAVCDAYGPRAKAAAERFKCPQYRSHKELLADPKVDVVCIATPDRLHAPQAIDAVKAG